MNFSTTKYKEVNKMVVIKCVEHYIKYWKHRNEYMNDINMQHEGIIEQYENKKERIENGSLNQLKIFTRRCKINAQ